MKSLGIFLVVCLFGFLNAFWIDFESTSFVCPPPNGTSILLPNPEDCRQFYSCGDSGPILLTCQSGLWFNPLISACDYPENVPEGTCSLPNSTTTVVTTTEATTVPDNTTWSTTWWPNTTDEGNTTDSSTSWPNTTDSSTWWPNTTFETEATTEEMGNSTTPWNNGTTLWSNTTGNPGNDTDYYW